MALLTAAIFAVGAIGIFAQDACDLEAQVKLGDQFRAEFADKSIPGRKKAINTGKSFLEKYGACESAADLAKYLKDRLPGFESTVKKMEEEAEKAALYTRFDTAVKAKNWDDTYASGKLILAKEPDQVDVMITLGSIGYDELFAGNTAFKHNDDTIRFAKQAIAAIEAGKPTQKFGLFGWAFGTKERALAELNLTIGYITQVAQKNKVAAAPYLYKVTQTTAPETAKNPIPYELIGYYYFDELDKLTTEIKAMADSQKPEDTPEDAKVKVDAIKAKVALANGTSERAIEAFSRAYTLGTAKAYKDKMYGNIKGAYKLRFAKEEGVDAFISEAVKKPFQNPTTPVTPISDPEPVTTTTGGPGTGVGNANGTGVGAGNGTGIGAANGSGIGAAKPASAPAKPASAAAVKPKN